MKRLWLSKGSWADFVNNRGPDIPREDTVAGWWLIALFYTAVVAVPLAAYQLVEPVWAPAAEMPSDLEQRFWTVLLYAALALILVLGVGMLLRGSFLQRLLVALPTLLVLIWLIGSALVI